MRHEVSGEHGNWEEILPAVKDLPKGWCEALSAMWYAYEAVDALDSCNRMVECFEHNTKQEVAA